MSRSNHDYRAPGALRRLPGEKWVDFSARQRAEQPAPKPPKKVTRRAANRNKRDTDRVDGFDRDDLGESPDF